MYMVMLVLDDPNRLDDVLEAWSEQKIGGATIVESTGIGRRVSHRQVHARYDFGNVGDVVEAGNYTLFAIVPDEETARRCLAAVEAIVGDLDGPNTGVLAAWPLAMVKGVPPAAAPFQEHA